MYLSMHLGYVNLETNVTHIFQPQTAYATCITRKQGSG